MIIFLKIYLLEEYLNIVYFNRNFLQNEYDDQDIIYTENKRERKNAYYIKRYLS
jgi:hypothetical protein